MPLSVATFPCCRDHDLFWQNLEPRIHPDAIRCQACLVFSSQFSLAHRYYRWMMNVNEEQLAFFEQVGRAITDWAHVEIALGDVVSACFGDAEREAAAIALVRAWT